MFKKRYKNPVFFFLILFNCPLNYRPRLVPNGGSPKKGRHKEISISEERLEIIASEQLRQSSQDWVVVGKVMGARAGSVHQALDGRERDRRGLVTHGASAVTFVSWFGGLLGHEVGGHVVR